MYEIKKKKYLNKQVVWMDIHAPLVVKNAKPGQFIILRVNEGGERIPLTIARIDKENGLVTIIFQIVGRTTMELSLKNEGDHLEAFTGPLGKATELDGLDRVCLVAGGVGSAIALSIAQELAKRGVNLTTILGFRNQDLVILEDEFKAYSNELIITTDDGSYGKKGNVVERLKEQFENREFDKVITIGPIIMMKYVSLACQENNTPVISSLNPIMIDGTGMCGGCRVSIIEDGKKVMRFACVDGPDFDGAKVDYDELMKRNQMYIKKEREDYNHLCNLLKEGEER